jgi:Bacterial Ig-like domain (group 3)/Autotransporter beta-domain
VGEGTRLTGGVLKTIWQIGRAAVARMRRRCLLSALRATRHGRRALGRTALAAAAIFLLSLGAAHALTGTSLTVSASPISSTFGQAVTFTVTVSSATTTGTPTGSVTFSFTDNTTGATGTFGPAPLNPGPGAGEAQAVLTTTALPAGSLTITSTYSGDGNFSGNSLQTPFSVSKAVAQTVITSSLNPSTFGQSVTFTVTVSPIAPGAGTPTGTVTLTVNGTPTTLTLVGGQATFTTSTLPPGAIPILATYNGDNNFDGGSNASFTQTVLDTTSIGLVASQNPSTLNQPVIFTASVSGTHGGTPTGSVTFFDQTTNQTLGTIPLLDNGGGDRAILTISTLGVGTHNITATYNGDVNFASSTTSINQTVSKIATATTLTASPNPSTPGQAVTFTATVKPAGVSGTPTGTVTFKDGGTTLGAPVTLNGSGSATFTTSTLASGSHTITAIYSGDPSFAGSTSAPLVQQVGAPADSIKLRELQISATPIIAQAWAQSVTAAMDDATTVGFAGNPQSLTPAGTGFTYYFDGDQSAQPSAATDQDSLNRFLASPNGNAKRVNDDFGALGYAGGMPTKAPPPLQSSAPHDWLAWINVRGTDFWRGTFGNDLKGEQVDAIAGLTRRISPNFVVGVLGGYEHFDYSSQAFNGVLKGDGWTVGSYLGWKLSPNLRFDAGGAWSDLLANDVSGTAAGNFLGTRWLVNGGLTGTYPWQQFVLEPSARVFALWEHENAYTDSLGTLQAARNFETGRASVGVKAIYPAAWSWSAAVLSPYAGLYADYYFSRDDAQTAGLTTVPLLQGFSARATGGVAATFAGGATLGAGGEFGGIGSADHIWTWTARGRIPF